jgi:peroxiredoxin
MKKLLLALIVILLSAITAEGDQSLIGSKAPEFILLDQHSKSYNVRQDEGKIIILLVSDKKGSEQNKAWVERIEKKYKDKVPIVGIADIRGVPRAFDFLVKREFKDKPVSILLDWNGNVFTSYGLVQKVANIVLIDRKGFVRHIHSGEATADACESLFKEIDKLGND